jgi:hypothetical protein
MYVRSATACSSPNSRRIAKLRNFSKITPMTTTKSLGSMATMTMNLWLTKRDASMSPNNYKSILPLGTMKCSRTPVRPGQSSQSPIIIHGRACAKQSSMYACDATHANTTNVLYSTVLYCTQVQVVHTAHDGGRMIMRFG